MTNASKILRIGLIGLGGATKQMLPSLLGHPHVRITGATDLRREARDTFASEFGEPAYEDAEHLCSSSNVDAIYVASPHQFHKDHVLMAAAYGKHIIVEKPMALTLSECDAMIEAVDQADVYMVVGHTHAFDQPIVKMREIIRSGELGRLAMINSWSYGNFLYRPRRSEELRTELGGGIIYNQVPHQVDMVRWLGGGLVRSVRSQAWVLDAERPTEGSHLTFLQFANGSAASLVFSGYDYFDSDEFHFWVGESGEEKAPNQHGSARAALSKLASPAAEATQKLARLNAGSLLAAAQSRGGKGRYHHPHAGVTIVSCAFGDMRPSADGVLVYGRNGIRAIPIPVAMAFPDKSGVISELHDCIVTGRAPSHDGRWGKATMEVSEAVLTSAREQREVFLLHQVPTRDAP